MAPGLRLVLLELGLSLLEVLNALLQIPYARWTRLCAFSITRGEQHGAAGAHLVRPLGRAAISRGDDDACRLGISRLACAVKAIDLEAGGEWTTKGDRTHCLKLGGRVGAAAP